MNNYVVPELNEMEFAILIVMMLLITGVLMCYVGYLNSIKRNHLEIQLDMIDKEIENCDLALKNEYNYRIKELVKLRKKIKSKIDKA